MSDRTPSYKGPCTHPEEHLTYTPAISGLVKARQVLCNVCGWAWREADPEEFKFRVEVIDGPKELVYGFPDWAQVHSNPDMWEKKERL